MEFHSLLFFCDLLFVCLFLGGGHAWCREEERCSP